MIVIPSVVIVFVVVYAMFRWRLVQEIPALSDQEVIENSKPLTTSVLNTWESSKE